MQGDSTVLTGILYSAVILERQVLVPTEASWAPGEEFEFCVYTLDALKKTSLWALFQLTNYNKQVNILT